MPLILFTLLKPWNIPRIRINTNNENVQRVSQKVPPTTCRALLMKQKGSDASTMECDGM
jgi:hypothetical protein